MRIEEWQLAAARASSPTWTGDLADDCVAYWAGLTLRAEWTNGSDWWWAVVDQATGEEIASSNGQNHHVTSGEVARDAAEVAARTYLNVNEC